MAINFYLIRAMLNVNNRCQCVLTQCDINILTPAFYIDAMLKCSVRVMSLPSDSSSI